LASTAEAGAPGVVPREEISSSIRAIFLAVSSESTLLLATSDELVEHRFFVGSGQGESVHAVGELLFEGGERCAAGGVVAASL
jgi:hypothetical protein